MENKNTLILIVLVLVIIISAVVIMVTPQTAPAAKPVIPANSKPTAVSVSVGEYRGINPDILFRITENNMVKFTSLEVEIVVNDETITCRPIPGDGRDFTMTSSLYDGSFEYARKDWNVSITGQIAGSAAHGKYIIGFCNSLNRRFEPPLEGEWSAAFTPPATLSPTFTPPAPPKAGHFEGINPYVSFDVTSSGVILNFTTSISTSGGTCSLSQTGDWQLNDLGRFTAYFGDNIPRTIINGYVEGGTANGSYQIPSCGSVNIDKFNIPFGEWNAKWVSP